LGSDYSSQSPTGYYGVFQSGRSGVQYNVLSLNPAGGGIMINKRPTTSAGSYALEVNGSILGSTINSNAENVYGIFIASATGSINHRIMSDVAPGGDSRQLLIGSKANTNLYMSLGVSTGTNLANSGQTSYCTIQGLLSGSYYTNLSLNPAGGPVLINKFPATSITGSACDINGRLDCTSLYINGRNNERTAPSSLYTNITIPAYWDFYVNGDFNYSFNTPIINRGSPFNVSSGQITCVLSGSYLLTVTICMSGLTQNSLPVTGEQVMALVLGINQTPVLTGNDFTIKHFFQINTQATTVTFQKTYTFVGNDYIKMKLAWITNNGANTSTTAYIYYSDITMIPI